MKRSPLLVAAAALSLAACGPAQVVVTAEVETQDPTTGETTTVSLSDLELQLVPFNRDQVFDSLSNAFSTPEPEIPQDLLDARDEIAAAQQEWRTMENRWNTLRDTLQKITDAMDGLSRGSGEYRVLFNDYNDLEGEYLNLENQVEAAFERFDSLQKASIGRTQEVRIQQDNWAAEAFAEIDPVFEAKIDAAGLPMAYDTTDASGVAVFEVPPGEYYVVGWYEEVYTELYWNVPVSVVKGEPVTVTLTRANAEVRTKL